MIFNGKSRDMTFEDGYSCIRCMSISRKAMFAQPPALRSDSSFNSTSLLARKYCCDGGIARKWWRAGLVPQKHSRAEDGGFMVVPQMASLHTKFAQRDRQLHKVKTLLVNGDTSTLVPQQQRLRELCYCETAD
eukprot:gnl/TRDRNA2_/TRDRNA2_126996_c0_seq1.p1 gnl/TRDRNA2_/TRDRNA2_126996_c0~~gnl/TRDRNA2_/TRDRNA2_126996_c0_seq1.p1  ORF type:complete len:133 (+),score=9.42 gnl/TRDRNA2_/TRDRNA2_126996_c0_seq1:57-455(+)